MKIAICLIGNMTLRNRDWNRTKNNIYKNIIDCWGEGNEVSVHICSEQIPKDIVDFYKVKSYEFQKYHHLFDVSFTFLCDILLGFRLVMEESSFGLDTHISN